MKKSIKIIVSLALALSMIMSFGMVSFAVEAVKSDIRVILDGNFIDFASVSPQMINGRVMIPFEPVASALGAKTTYDAPTKVITAVLGDTVIKFTQGSDILEVSNGGEVTSTVMDVKPVTLNGRLLIPVRYASESFGVNVSWDKPNRTVVLIDFVKTGKMIDEKFSIINEFTKLNFIDEKTYEIKEKMTCSIDYKDEFEESSQKFEITADSIVKGTSLITNANINLGMNEQIDIIIKEAGDILPNGAEAILNLLKKPINMELIIDSEKNDLYIKSVLFDMLFNLITEELAIEVSVKENSWYKLDLDMTEMVLPALMGGDIATDELEETLPFDIEALMENFTIGNLFATILGSSEGYTLDAYTMMNVAINLVEAIAGDKTITKTEANGAKTYTWNMNNEKLVSNFIGFLLSNQEIIEMLMNAPANAGTDEEVAAMTLDMPVMPGFDITFSVTIKDNMIIASKVDASLEMAFDEEIAMRVKVSSDSKKVGKSAATIEMTVASSDEEYGDMEMTFKCEYTSTSAETNKTPNFVPAPGSNIIDLWDIILGINF